MKVLMLEEEDMSVVRGWETRRDIPEVEGWYSQTAFWVPDVLAAWMYSTDSAIALIDNVIANPDTTSKQRKEAMHLVSTAIADHARSLGYKWLRGLTAYETVAANGREAGYRVSQPTYMTMILDLTGNN